MEQKQASIRWKASTKTNTSIFQHEKMHEISANDDGTFWIKIPVKN